MAQTLAQLLSPQTQVQVQQLCLAALQSATPPFPTTDWNTGSPENTMVQMFSTVLWDLSSGQIVNVAGGGLVDLSSGDWLTLLAAQVYNLTKLAATFTQGNVVLTSAAGAGPYTIAAFQLLFLSSSGLRYTNTAGGTLNANSTLTLAVQSEFANNSLAGLNYVDANSTITQMVTPLPGVTVNNPGTTYGTVSQAGIGTGTIAPTGASPTAGNYTIRIDVSGQSGAASWSWSNDGTNFTSVGAVSSSALGGTGITVTLSNGSVNPSFVAGDKYVFSAPGSWVTSQGADQETDIALRIRCKARWPSLSAVPNNNVYDLWARSANQSVTQTLIQVDGTTPGQVNVWIAGPGGSLGGSIVNAVQSYINARAGVTDKPVVLSATNQAVTITNASGTTATVYYRSSANLASLQAAVQLAVNQYITTFGVSDGTKKVSLGEIIAAFETGVTSATPVDPILGARRADPTITGNVIRASGFALTGSDSSGDLVIATTDVPTIGSIAGMVTWTAV
jgi:hypothetical protein